MALIGSRVNVLSFDEESGQSQSKKNDSQFAIAAEINQMNDELIICTRKDLRFYSTENGKLKRIMQGLLESEEDEISVFKILEQFNRFLIGNQKGEMLIFDMESGRRLSSLKAHESEPISIHLDFDNKLFISCALDNTI